MRTRTNQQHLKEFINYIDKRNNNRNTDVRYYVSIDIEKKNCVVCITNKDGSIVLKKYSNTLSGAFILVQHIDQQYDGINYTAVVEFTANMWI